MAEEYDRQMQEDLAEWEDYLSTEEAIPGEKVVSWLKEMLAQNKYVAWHDWSGNRDSLFY